MIQWIENFIEQPQAVVGNLPVCPFARAARLRRAIRFEVMPFRLDDPLESGGRIMTLVHALLADRELETLFVIHPDPDSIGARPLEAFVAGLNARLACSETTACLQAFEAHPESTFCIGGLYTRRGPYPSFQVLSRELLKTASDSLLGTQYYDLFTSDMLRAVGMPR